jgi:SAM-dependent methyltransferase
VVTVRAGVATSGMTATFEDLDPTADLAAPIRRLTIVPFGDDVEGVVLYRDEDRLRLLSSDVRAGEDPLIDTSLRVAMDLAGFRRQETFAFARAGDHVAIWCHGARHNGGQHDPRPEWWSGDPAEAARLLEQQGDHLEAELVRRGDAARRNLSEAAYYAVTQRLLERAYLRGTTPQEGSGFSGSDVEWRAARGILCDAIASSGSFLDVGCANGHLMASMVTWCAERGLRLEPFGVDHSAALIAEARRRHPQWTDRLWVGNAVDWVPPAGLRFDVVHTLLDLVPEAARARLVHHLLAATVKEGGRLLVSNYVPENDHRRASTVLRALGFTVAGETAPSKRTTYVGAPSAWLLR